MSPEKANLRVLIADDEKMIADTLALIFRQKGCEAKAVYSGEAAIEEAGKLRPDVLISDVVMGGITGIDAAICVRQHYPNCRIILFSGQAATINLLEAARQKGETFEILTKPIPPQVLLDRLNVSA